MVDPIADSLKEASDDASIKDLAKRYSRKSTERSQRVKFFTQLGVVKGQKPSSVTNSAKGSMIIHEEFEDDIRTESSIEPEFFERLQVNAMEDQMRNQRPVRSNTKFNINPPPRIR